MTEQEAAIHDRAYGLGMRAGLNWAEGPHAESARRMADRLILDANRVLRLGKLERTKNADDCDHLNDVEATTEK